MKPVKPRKSSQKHFTKMLCALMDENKTTVRQAAKVAGVGASTINSWRSGARPEDFNAVRRLAQHFGISLSLFLTGEEEKIPSIAIPAVSHVFDDGGIFFDGYARIRIERLIPRKKEL